MKDAMSLGLHLNRVLHIVYVKLKPPQSVPRRQSECYTFIKLEDLPRRKGRPFSLVIVAVPRVLVDDQPEGRGYETFFI